MILVAYVIALGLPSLQLAVISEPVPVRLRHRLADARLHGVRDRGVPRGHRIGASEPADGGALTRPDLRADDAHVILPQAIRRVVPPLLNDFIGLQKDTAIITVIGLTEAIAQAGFYSNDFFSYAGYTVAAIFFVILTIPFARFTDHLIKQRERRERAQLV